VSIASITVLVASRQVHGCPNDDNFLMACDGKSHFGNKFDLFQESMAWLTFQLTQMVARAAVT
jgi:hypothetical protein